MKIGKGNETRCMVINQSDMGALGMVSENPNDTTEAAKDTAPAGNVCT